MKVVAIYTRVSTQEQAADGYSIGEQADRLTKYCEAHGWTIANIYTDPGHSGAKLDRPALNRMFRDAEKHLFDTVLIYKLDRLSRSQKDTLYIIEDIFAKHDIGLVSMSENFDTSTPFGKAMIGILSVFAQLEREQIKERMTMGRIGRAKAGKYSGGSNPPIGYNYVDGELIINDYEALQVREIYDLFLNGKDGKELSLTEIQKIIRSKYTNRYSSWKVKCEIGNILRDRVYIGEVRFQKQYYPGIHEPIIDQEIFDAVQTKYDKRMASYSHSMRAPFSSTHLLTGITYCGLCGARYGVYTSSQKAVKYKYYVCYTRRRTHRAMMMGKECRQSPRFPISDLDKIVISEIEKIAVDLQQIDDIANKKIKNDTTSEILQKRLQELDHQEEKLLDLYQLDTFDVSKLTARMEDIKTQREKVQASLDALSSSQPRMSIETAKNIISTFQDSFSVATAKQKRTLIRALIDRIDIYPDHVEISWAFIP